MEEELEEMQSTSRFDFSVLRNPKFLLYLAYVILHAGGMLTIIILQPRYIEETKNMTGKTQKNKAGYTAALAACGWAGAVLEKVTRASG